MSAGLEVGPCQALCDGQAHTCSRKTKNKVWPTCMGLGALGSSFCLYKGPAHSRCLVNGLNSGCSEPVVSAAHVTLFNSHVSPMRWERGGNQRQTTCPRPPGWARLSPSAPRRPPVPKAHLAAFVGLFQISTCPFHLSRSTDPFGDFNFCHLLNPATSTGVP